MAEVDEDDNILNSAFSDDVEEVSESEDELEDVKGETEDAEETETEVTEETEETESEPPSQPGHVPIAALTAERRKRQEAAEKLEHYEEIPDPVESPKEYADFVRNQAQSGELQSRINLSRSIMLDLDPEYTVYEAEFMQAVSATDGEGNVSITNQDLYNQFVQSDNPAKFARDMGKDIKVYRERMDPNYEQKLRASWEAEKANTTVDEAAEVSHLTDATSQGSNSEPETPETGLDNVFEGSPL